MGIALSSLRSGRALLAAVALSGGIALGGIPQAEAADESLLPVGGEAPLFQGTDIDGNAFSLEEVLGEKAAFLVFWSIF